MLNVMTYKRANVKAATRKNTLAFPDRTDYCAGAGPDTLQAALNTHVANTASGTTPATPTRATTIMLWALLRQAATPLPQGLPTVSPVTTLIKQL